MNAVSSLQQWILVRQEGSRRDSGYDNRGAASITLVLSVKRERVCNCQIKDDDGRSGSEKSQATDAQAWLGGQNGVFQLVLYLLEKMVCYPKKEGKIRPWC